MENKNKIIIGILILIIVVQIVAATSYFIPTKTQAEWDAFVTYADRYDDDDISYCGISIDGGYGDTWGDWSICRDGKKHRTKLCNSPSPICGGYCPDSDATTREQLSCGGTTTTTTTTTTDDIDKEECHTGCTSCSMGTCAAGACGSYWVGCVAYSCGSCSCISTCGGADGLSSGSCCDGKTCEKLATGSYRCLG